VSQAASRPGPDPRPVSLAVALITALIGALLLVIPQSDSARADSSAGGGDFVPLANAGRLVDTRNGTGISGTAPLRDGQDKAFKVLGVGGVPATGVRAVLLDVTIVAPTNHTWFRLWADGTPMPTGTSMVHSIPGENFSNTAVVPVGENGSVRVFNNTGTAHAVIDVQGYFTGATTGGGTGGFVPITQTRALDTRETGGEIKANATRTVNLSSSAAIPTTATSAFVNVIVVGATVAGSLELSAGASATGGSFNHPTGTSSTGMSVKLSAGKATITNSSTKPVQVVIDVQGYFSPTSTQGAGYREASARLIDTRSSFGGGAIPARTAREIPVGGAGGLPVRSLAGVLLNFQTLQGSDAGWISAWPTGTTRPSATVGNTTAGDIRAELAIIKPGANGKISVYNGSDTPINLILDLEGYFLDPLPSVGIEANSRTSIIQTTPTDPSEPGRLEFSYVNNSGEVVHGDIPSPEWMTPDGTNMEKLSGSETFSGTPAIAEQANGKVLIAGHHTESNVWAKTASVNPVPEWPSAWTKLGGSIRSHAAVGKLSDGRLVLFGVDVDGALWANAQTVANGAFGAWTALGDVDLTGTPVVVNDRGGAVQVFARNLTGSIVTATYSTGGVLSSWVGLGSPGVALDESGVPAVAVGPSLIRVFVRTTGGDIATQQQSVGGAWSGTWETIPGAAAGGPPTVVVHPTNGTYQVLTRISSGDFQWASEMTRNSATWSTWRTITARTGALISDPTAFAWTGRNADWTATTPNWGVIYRTASDVTQIVNFTNVTSPPAPEGVQGKSGSAKKPANGSRSTPEFHTYKAPK
jgi:hypothetical protein